MKGEAKPREDVIKYLLQRLEILQQWMEKQTFYRFYSSSLLFVFDGSKFFS